jgi:hypothetical protein
MSGEAKHTPGPWGWFGNPHRGLCIAAKHSGRRYVMQFARWGMQAAQPRFQVNDRMVDGAELLKFEVGDRDVTGVTAAKANSSVYRLDVIDIDHPDARLMIASPDLLEAAKSIERWSFDSATPIPDEVYRPLRAAIAKAEGRS